MKIELTEEKARLENVEYDDHSRQRVDYQRQMAVMTSVRAVHEICDQLTESVEEEEFAIATVAEKLVQELVGQFAAAALRVDIMQRTAKPLDALGASSEGRFPLR